MHPIQHEDYLDWLQTLQEDIGDEDPEAIFDRFWGALEPSTDEETYYALAACEVIAAVLGRPSRFLSAEISKWANKVADRFDQQLARNAYNFVAPIASSGDELSDYAADLKSRLS